MATTISRSENRSASELRNYQFERGFIKTAEGSVLVSCGDTRVIVTAKVDTNVPNWMRGQGHGWVTAEYSMLPGSSQDRIRRDRNGPSGRSAEIQRLIGRSLRAMVDLKKLPEVTINIDCDVIQADGGTRTASISGAYIAVYDCLRALQKDFIIVESEKNKVIRKIDAKPEMKTRAIFPDALPILNQVAAVSVGIKDGTVLLDLDYIEDSSAQADSNFILTADGRIIEIQGTAEDGPFSKAEFDQMFAVAHNGIKKLCELQVAALNS